MDNWLTSAIGKLLREKRHALGLSSREAAVQVGISAGLLLQIERGAVDVDICVLNDLCALLRLTVTELFNQIYFNDSERIAVLSPDRADALVQTLQCAHRDVVGVKDPASLTETLRNLRIDLLVIDARAGSNVLSELCLSDSKDKQQMVFVAVNSRIKLSSPADCKLDVVKVLPTDASFEEARREANEILGASAKGRICALRRHREELSKRVQTLIEQGQTLTEQRAKLSSQIDVMNSRQSRLSVERGIGVNRADETRTIEQRKEELEQLAQQLAARENKVAAQEQANSEISRFLKRNEQWLEADELSDVEQ